jgi:hypothetical protein
VFLQIVDLHLGVYANGESVPVCSNLRPGFETLGLELRSPFPGFTSTSSPVFLFLATSNSSWRRNWSLSCQMGVHSVIVASFPDGNKNCHDVGGVFGRTKIMLNAEAVEHRLLVVPLVEESANDQMPTVQVSAPPDDQI